MRVWPNVWNKNINYPPKNTEQNNNKRSTALNSQYPLEQEKKKLTVHAANQWWYLKIFVFNIKNARARIWLIRRLITILLYKKVNMQTYAHYSLHVNYRLVKIGSYSGIFILEISKKDGGQLLIEFGHKYLAGYDDIIINIYLLKKNTKRC